MTDSVTVDIFSALSESLRVAYHLFNVLEGGVFAAEQILHDLNFSELVNVESAEKGKVHNLSHVAVVAVFNGQHGAVAFSLFHRLIGSLEIGIGKGISVFENLFGRNVGKGALNSAVGYLHAVHKTALIPL